MKIAAKRKTNTYGIRIPKIEKVIKIVRANAKVNTISAYILMHFDEHKFLTEHQHSRLVMHYIQIIRRQLRKKRKAVKLAANKPLSTSHKVILRKAI